MLIIHSTASHLLSIYTADQAAPSRFHSLVSSSSLESHVYVEGVHDGQRSLPRCRPFLSLQCSEFADCEGANERPLCPVVDDGLLLTLDERLHPRWRRLHLRLRLYLPRYDGIGGE